MKWIKLIIVSVLFLNFVSSCSFDSRNKDLKVSKEKMDSFTVDSENIEGSNSKDNDVDELIFEFQLQNDSTGRYFSKGIDFPIFIITDSSGNIPYDSDA